MLLLATLQANGSVLLATSPDEVVQLEARAAMLTQQGIKGVRLMAREALLREEPALTLPRGSAGLLVATDAQLVCSQLSELVTEPVVRPTISVCFWSR